MISYTCYTVINAVGCKSEGLLYMLYPNYGQCEGAEFMSAVNL